MATHKSAIKEHRQSQASRLRNRYHRSRLRTALKNHRQAIDAGETELAKSLLPSSLALIDRTAKLGAIHPNAADRAKSRLARAINRL